MASQHVGLLRQASPHLRTPAALEALHGAYATAKARGLGVSRHPWTREATLELGRLFVAAWGTRPTPSQMEKHYGLPPRASILRLWGSYAAYYAAIEGRA